MINLVNTWGRMYQKEEKKDKLEGVIESIKGSIGNVEINTTAAREHVDEIERDIRTGKEQ